MRTAQRIEKLPPYLFVGISRAIAEKKARGEVVITFGIGDPDIPTPAHILDRLHEASQDPQNHRYPESEGLPQLRRAIAAWYEHRFGTPFNPDKEVLPLIGSKEGIGHIAFCFIDPGDVALVPDPSYPVYPVGTLLAGGEPYYLPLTEENDFLPDLEAVPPAVAQKAKLLWINYPNNPTAATAELDFFERVVAFAKRNDLAVCHDMAYSEVAFDGYRPHSFMEVPGAKEVGVEFHSFSKSYNMTGWRLGMIVGNARMVDALMRVKSNLDSGIPQAIQLAGIAAFEGPQGCIAEHNAVYQRRRDRVAAVLRELGLKVRLPKASLYIWARLPDGERSIPYASRLLEEASVVVTPGVGYGQQGEGYIRLSLTTPDDQVEEGLRRLRAWHAAPQGNKRGKKVKLAQASPKGGTTRDLYLTARPAERAFLLGVETKESPSTGSFDKLRTASGRRQSLWTAQESLDELAQLVNTAGGVVVGRLYQKLRSPHRQSYIGPGKLDEVAAIREQYDTVVCDDELTPSQQQHLESTLQAKVIDRTALILDIFAQRARTHEGRLQVELAQHQYLLPRLAGRWAHLERLGGGIGTRGPGESQLETDRRLIRRKIGRLQEQLDEVSQHRSLYRRQRSRQGLPVIAIVGYTNAGKSALFNALCKAEVPVEDKLFATLDPTTRRLWLPSGQETLLTDTVGFIQKLPPAVVAAFRATLEELEEASLLLHVVDITHPKSAQQGLTVDDTLGQLGLAQKRRVTAFNKVDLLVSPAGVLRQDQDSAGAEEALRRYDRDLAQRGLAGVVISATRGWGLDKLVRALDRALSEVMAQSQAVS